MSVQRIQTPLYIKNGIIVNDTGILEADIYVEDGIIEEVGVNQEVPPDTRIIDAANRYIFPGGIDPHTHLEEEFMGLKTADDFYQGTRAAVAGGTTTIIDYIIPKPNQSLLEAFSAKRQAAYERSCCDYSFHVCVRTDDEVVKGEMSQLVTNEFGVNSFKFYMAYKNDLMLNDSELYNLFEKCKQIGALALVHAENGDIIEENVKRLLRNGVTGPQGHCLSRPEETEAEAVNRAAMIANQVNCPLYIVHVMSKTAAETLAAASARGNIIFGETIVAAIGADGVAYQNASFDYAAGHILSPPLRTDPETPEFLLKHLMSDTLQTIASDHCTFTKAQKAQGKDNFSLIPNGVNGIEERLSILWENGVQTGIMDMPKFVEVTSTKAARIFNLYPRKGVIQIGSDADIVIWNPNHSQTISSLTHNSASDFNIFEGRQVLGAPEYVIVNGHVCVDKFELKIDPPIGRFVPTLPWSPYVYDMIKNKHINRTP